MIFDYCEQEMTENGMQLHIGLQFEDEPDSLYVAELSAGADGTVTSWMLYFNGFDCKYSFKPEEKEALIRYAAEQGIPIADGTSGP
ncbi:hypothetical protein ACFPES_10950 [Paenibacillus sp. GCM10023248]|uniref:hypothetical protein n=1 Tax=unclassified Paenibacillus TaxID=185978 RepID=UPI0023794EF4|nr:hypothetical protein [Paenibacillus sp. MAHUQ-63]MDD9267541.1 hypothetical protein [Paenibacillus sp. MAHUQ-63]